MKRYSAPRGHHFELSNLSLLASPFGFALTLLDLLNYFMQIQFHVVVRDYISSLIYDHSIRLIKVRTASAHKLLKMSRKLVNREEKGIRIAQISGAVMMINKSNYLIRSKSSDNPYTVTATQSEWICSCPDYARHNAKCKHVYAVEFYRGQSAHLGACL